MYGLIGYPLDHSFSASFFNEKFKREGINEEYINFPLSSLEGIVTLLTNYKNLKGLNVTIPYKTSVIRYLDKLTEEAAFIGAVNVIKIKRNNDIIELKGYNTDKTAFIKSFKPLLKHNEKKALILGTGGASKAVRQALKSLDIDFTLISRDPKEGQIGYSDLTKEIVEDADIIINTTPVGMAPNITNVPPFPFEFIRPGQLCYDLIYNPEETLFLKYSKEQGARIKNGKEMLILQAEESWDIWNQNY